MRVCMHVMFVFICALVRVSVLVWSTGVLRAHLYACNICLYMCVCVRVDCVYPRVCIYVWTNVHLLRAVLVFCMRECVCVYMCVSACVCVRVCLCNLLYLHASCV